VTELAIDATATAVPPAVRTTLADVYAHGVTDDTVKDVVEMIEATVWAPLQNAAPEMVTPEPATMEPVLSSADVVTSHVKEGTTDEAEMVFGVTASPEPERVTVPDATE